MHHTQDNKGAAVYLHKVLEYIQNNLFEDLSLQRISDIAHYSPFHFQRIFTEQVGESPKQYIIRLRLERLAHYLKVFPELPVSELAAKGSFSSVSTFSRAFKNYFGISPQAYRENPGNDYHKKCKSDSKKCKINEWNTTDLWSGDLSSEEIMDWRKKVEITTRKQAGLKIIYQATVLDHPDSISLAYQSLCRWADPRALISEQTRFIGMLLDIPFITPIEKCRYWAGITVPEQSLIPRDAGVTTLPDGLYATYRMAGNLSAVMKSLVYFSHSWLNEHGYAIKEVLGYEIFNENPAHKPSETINREILIPIRPA